MAVQKTQAVILKVQPYRETSCLLYLLTRDHGILHGLAKGVKRKKSGSSVIERGINLELIAYVKPNRDLHTITNMQMTDSYQSIRTSLEKSTIRDAAFELILKTITLSDPHPELFEFLTGFLNSLNSVPLTSSFPYALWDLYNNYSRILGFGINLDTCITCSLPIDSNHGGTLVLKKGGLECQKCKETQHIRSHIPARVLDFLKTEMELSKRERLSLPKEDQKRITHLLATYCAFHFDISQEFKSLKFMDDLYRIN